MGRAERRRLEKERSRKPVTYQYTAEQIAEIRRQAVLQRKAELDEYVNKIVAKEFEERTKAIKGETTEETIQLVLCLLLAVPTKILCDKFGWQPVDAGSDRRARLKRFAELVVAEVNRISDDEMIDIRDYAKQVLDECGVGYEVIECNE